MKLCSLSLSPWGPVCSPEGLVDEAGEIIFVRASSSAAKVSDDL